MRPRKGAPGAEARRTVPRVWLTTGADLLQSFMKLCSFLLSAVSFVAGSNPQTSTRRQRRAPLAFALVLALGSSPLFATAQNAVFKIPPVKIPLEVKDQRITITASAILTLSSKDRNLRILNLQLTGDLSDLQHNLTSLLSAQLDKDDRCGERVAIQNATLTPAEPAAVAVVRLHVERWSCVKLLVKQKAQKLVGGDAQIPIKLTPAIEKDSTELQLVPEVGEIQGDGSLGELLRCGELAETIREKIRSSILSALNKGTNLAATLPPAVQGYVTIQNAEFKDGGG